MSITYRRTGGVVAVLAVAAAALAAAVLTVAVGIVVLVLGAAAGMVALAVRAVLPGWRRPAVPGAASPPRDTIETTAVVHAGD